MSDQIPKEAKIISALLATSGITECEPKGDILFDGVCPKYPFPFLCIYLPSPFDQNHSRIVGLLGSCKVDKCDLGGCQTGRRIQFQAIPSENTVTIVYERNGISEEWHSHPSPNSGQHPEDLPAQPMHVIGSIQGHIFGRIMITFYHLARTSAK